MAKDRFDSYVKAAYLAALAVALFTGIGNMPMWGRYFVADIPGFGWSGNFFINLYIHYLSGALLLAISTYYIILYSGRPNRRMDLSLSGAIRATLLGLALVSGVLSALKNLPLPDLPLAGLMALIFVHLGTAMAYCFFSVLFWLMKKPWLKEH